MCRIISSPVSLLAATALWLSGCATTVEPRAFAPVVKPPPTDVAAFERDFSTCASQASEDAALFYRSHPERKSAKEDDVDLPLGGGAIGPGDMGSGAIGLVVLVIAAVQAGGRSHVRHAHRQATEQDIQAAMASCLKARGHTVTAWQLVKDGKASAAKFQTPTQPTERAQAEHWERLAETVSDPHERATIFELAAEIYGNLAEKSSDPTERTQYLEMAAKARGKAERAGPAPQPAPSHVPAPQPGLSPSAPPPGGARPPG